MLYGVMQGMSFGQAVGIEALAVCVLVFIFTVVIGRTVIPILRAKKLNQPINEYVAEHAQKAGTPTMGGICFILASLAVLLIWSLLESFGIIGDGSVGALIPFALTMCLGVGNAVIGFIDDYRKLVKKENEGLTSMQKMALQILIAAAYLCMMGMTGHLATSFDIPFTGYSLELGFFAYPLYLLVIVGFVNSTNITDGLDGLASSVGVAVSAGLIVMTVVGVGSLSADDALLGRYDAVVSASLLGSLLGFLIFNHYPAKVFMGDTGSLFLGGAVTVIAIGLKMPLILIIAGFVYLFEALSVILQVASYKLTKKRIFKMAPVHHHFEMCGWSEKKIVAVFSAVTFILCVIAVLAIVPCARF